MFKIFARHPGLMLSVGLTMGLLVGVGMLAGVLATVHCQPSRTLQMPETLLHASGSHSGESFAMATGMIDDSMEGVFLLDYLTGDLQCSVLSPRTGVFCAQFKYNVIADLGVQQGKKPNYVMVTGQAAFLRGSDVLAPGGCALYVADANTGNFAAYAVILNRTMWKAGAPQTGRINRLDGGKARALEIRE
jgi:hypothetical protein